MPLANPKTLIFSIKNNCSKGTKARNSTMELPHFTVNTPQFMPVGTSGVMKGLTSEQLLEIGCEIILGNTYHLALQPGKELMKELGGLHEFMKWPRGMLTDSGGFQMVSLLKFSEITEDGVEFVSPFDNVTKTLLTPEESMAIQNAIGADIIMQLDDVVSSLVTGPRVEEAMWRSIRWLDRCFEGHKRPDEQNLFPIIQGGLDLRFKDLIYYRLRKICIEEMVKRNANGYAIGGLSGGESKDQFWRIVSLCTDLLPKDKPRYLFLTEGNDVPHARYCMGVGYSEDLVVCSALGVDMYDCVFPTRVKRFFTQTARFGNALTRRGPLKLKHVIFQSDLNPIEKDCPCLTCKTYTRAYISRLIRQKETVGCHLISIHNIAYQMRLMKDIREAIQRDEYPEWIKVFMKTYYLNREMSGAVFDTEIDVDGEGKNENDPGKVLKDGYPVWILNALESVNIKLL